MKKFHKWLFAGLVALMLASCGSSADEDSSSLEPAPSSEPTVSEKQDPSSEDVPSEKEEPSEEIPSEQLPSEELPSEELPSEDTPSEEIPLTSTLSGTIKNLIDGPIQGAQVEVLGQTSSAISDVNGSFSLTDVSDEATLLKISAAGYADSFYNLEGKLNGEPTVILGDVSLNKEYGYLGHAESKHYGDPWSGWHLYVSRGLNNLVIKFESDKDVYVQNNENLELYISTKTALGHRTENDYQFIPRQNGTIEGTRYGGHGAIDVSSIDYRIDRVEGLSTTLYIEIPYTLINVTPTEIVGFGFGEWSTAHLDWSGQMMPGFIPSEQPTRFPRFDENNNVFAHHTNEPKPEEFDPALRAQLIEGYLINFANPLYNNQAATADDLHVKADFTAADSFTFNFIGFGEFTNEEWIKVILHTGENLGGWAIQPTDLVLRIQKDVAYLTSGHNAFWDHETQVYEEVDKTINAPVFTSYEQGYFTLDLALNYSELGSITADNIGDVTALFVEFGGNTIYDGEHAVLYKGIGTGDPANQATYVPIKEGETGVVVDKEALTTGYPISFANPSDVGNMNADDFYVKAVRDPLDTSVLTLDFIGFGNFTDSEFIKIVLHPGTNDGAGWAIQPTDTNIVLTKTNAYLKFGETTFWSHESGYGDATLYNPIFEQKEGYFTLTLKLDYSEFAGGVTAETPLRAMFIEFDGREIYGGPNAVRYEGIAIGDPAMQVNYVAF